MNLYRFVGGKPIDWHRLKHNFDTIVNTVNNLRDSNFKIFSRLNKNSFVGGFGIITQDCVLSRFGRYQLDAMPGGYGGIIRLKADGSLPALVDTLASGKGVIGAPTTEYMRVVNGVNSSFIFGTGGAVRAALSILHGWATGVNSDATPIATADMVFDKTRSLWVFYLDSTIAGYIDGNGITGNFVAGATAPTTTYEARQAYMDIDTTNHRIAFFCKTANDTAIKGCGYIDNTGMHNGGA